MKALKKKTKIVLIVALVAAALLLVTIVVFLPWLIQPALWTLLFLGIGFFAVEFLRRFAKKKKQEAFDEKVAAKEGIEDRKREWAAWIEELDRQGIDRYELPFYLIVGEPQSGKSVLLQNSDLYFPFGQDRLSGVGGTRGCDWWFTDEAVILDIAGRLFTHEGGVADKLEWEAFLDLLATFRPLCPANGILLVIPCDALLQDSKETCADKANKVQSALLTLTQKLQAQLPVYLILTKGDKIFGFAESVHRLDAETRHEMFGWSRLAEHEDRPFMLEEARAGFAEIVDRARLLRERMIASARLPEALPEVDRLYAFPEELAGMYGALEVYLKRIFSESSLVERVSFRGIYLSSGLQTGVPVAKVCADLLGDDRDSDARVLESLFSHQRAYFIKELVRDRVFRERGLVRPTEGRIATARRTTMLGYGAAGVVAVAAIIGAIIHVASARSEGATQTIETALAAGHASVGETRIPRLLERLHAVDAAVDVDRDVMREVFNSTREGFEQLYARICDRALVPTLRKELEERVFAAVSEAPASFDEFQRWLGVAMPLFDENGLDFADGSTQKLVEVWLRDQWAVRVVDPDGEPTEFTVARALAATSGTTVSRPDDRARLEPLARRLLELLDRSIDPATPWMARGHVGYLVAWLGAEDAAARIARAQRDRAPELLESCDVFANAVLNLEAIVEGPELPDQYVTNIGFVGEQKELDQAWKRLSEFLSPGTEPSWARMSGLMTAAKRVFAENKTAEQLPGSGIGGAIGRLLNRAQQELVGTTLAKLKVPHSPVRAWLQDADGLLDACRKEPHADWTLRSVASELAAESRKSNEVYDAKVEVMAEAVPGRYPSWHAASEEFHGGGRAPAADQLDLELVETVARVRRALDKYELGESAAAERLSDLLDEHLRVLADTWDRRTDWSGAVDWNVVTSLSRLAADAAIGRGPMERADRLRWLYLNGHEARLLDDWKARPESAAATVEIVRAVNEHLEGLERLGGADDPPPVDRQHTAWLGKVDAEVHARCAEHLAAIEKYWAPSTASWVDLRTAVEGIAEALDRDSLSRKIRGAESSIDAPDAGDKELGVRQPIASGGLLPNSRDALARLRSLATPRLDEFTEHELVVDLLAAAKRAERDLDDAKALAKTAIEMAPLPEEPSGGIVSSYVRPLHEALRGRLIARVRSEYVQELSRAVYAGGEATVIEALYATTPEEIGNVVDQEVVRRLDGLLRPGGRLEELRRKYRMVALEPDGPDLRPRDEAGGPPAETDWWAFDRFLIGLQGFFAVVTEGGRIEDAKFEVKFERPRRSAGDVWDIEVTGKQFFYYASSSRSRSRDPGFSTHDQRWGDLDKKLSWEFDTDRKPTLWFVWSNAFRPQFRYPDERDSKNDIWYEIDGCLAPLLLAWTGSVDEGWWVVDMKPKNTEDKARIRLSFIGPDGADLVLPRRPVTMPGKLD